MPFVDYKDLLTATNDGLDIIVMYYPDAADALQSRDKKFKIREERTASASIRHRNGSYHVTDFGGDQQERNAIGVCMLETGKTFAEAVSYLAEFFNVKGTKGGGFPEIKPDWDSRPLKDGEKAGDYELELKEFTPEELAQLGPCVTDDHCRDFNLKSVKSLTWVKENEVSITSSTDNYPMYAFDHDSWAKLYQPLSFKKQYRFRFLGDKPKRHIFGMRLLEKKVARNDERIMDLIDQAKDSGAKLTKDERDKREDNVFIVSGGSDGINLRSFGYYPIWFNSESEVIEFSEYRKLQTLAKNIIYVPDLDATGIKKGLEIALKYLDIKIMMLPDFLKRKRDKRGNSCKDFKDFVEQYFNPKEASSFRSRLSKLIENALPAQFWDEQWTEKGKKYQFRHTQFYNFLKINGFGRIKDENTKDGFHFVRNHGNVVNKILPVEIENFVHQFLKKRQLAIQLRDLIYSKPLNHNALSKLDHFNIAFNTSDRSTQFMFFENAVMQVTAEEIVLKRRGDVDRYIWDDKLLKHIIYLEDPHFTIKEDKDGNEDIEIHKTDNKFFNYLINASRIHWRKELEDSVSGYNSADRAKYLKENKFAIAGPNLEPDEQLEQKLHLKNKIYALGYLLHTYKAPQKPWAVYAMDNKLADVSESHGGSGKSVFLKAVQHILKENHYINGRDSKKTTDDFIYHGVTKDSDYIMVDDCHFRMDYGFFFNAITGDLEVNNKNGLRFVIPFDEVPKIAFSSNYPPNNLDPSLARRLLYAVFSDYYHHNQEDEYRESRAVSDDFDGQTLFKDFDEHQWNSFYNFCAQCVQFYLQSPVKVDPPMDNVTMRNLMAEMGSAFLDWADVYFSIKDDQGNYKYIDSYVIKDEAFDDLKNKTGLKFSPNKFKKKLQSYAKYKEWIFNPTDTGITYDANGRIMIKVDKETKEHFYIKTDVPKMTEALKSAAHGVDDIDVDPDDELPF